MSLHWQRAWRWTALLVLALCAPMHTVLASTDMHDAAHLLTQTESLRTQDHPRFVQMLEQLHRQAPTLTAAERWHLRYLDAWQTAFQGDYAKANGQLQDVIDDSGDTTLAAKASALLMSNLSINGRYSEAFALAQQLVTDLPNIGDALARFTVLANLSQTLNFAGQTELALKYARMNEDALPPGETRCNPLSMQTAALYNGKQLTTSSAELHRAIDACVAAGQSVYTETLWLIMSDLYLTEDHPQQSLSLLHRISPGIQTNRYFSHQLGLQVALAQTYWKLGDDSNARKAALAAVTMSGANELNEWLREAYRVLYQVARKQDDPRAALGYYEHFAAQDKGHIDDISARALAYQSVQQNMLAKKLETEELSKQNSILRLQKALETKAVETSRLYIVLLLLTLAFLAFWAWRLKRSQLRFKQLSHRDSLTGILNHQFFISEAERVLHAHRHKLSHACLISIDLDHFKQVNDTYGHAMGDAVLKWTVAICQQQLRPTDLFGRLGGEEFGILLPECSRQQGMEIANRIRRAIEGAPMEQDNHIICTSASVGLAGTDHTGYGLQSLCREADAALYRAKHAGRNRVMTDAGIDTLLEA